METLVTLSDADYQVLLSKLKNTYKPPALINIYGDGSELNFEEDIGVLRFHIPNARKHVKYVDVQEKRSSDNVQLLWNPPDKQPLCSAAILALGLTVFTTTLFLLLLVSRSLYALTFHGFMLMVFLISAKIDKNVRSTVTERIRAAIQLS